VPSAQRQGAQARQRADLHGQRSRDRGRGMAWRRDRHPQPRHDRDRRHLHRGREHRLHRHPQLRARTVPPCTPARPAQAQATAEGPDAIVGRRCDPVLPSVDEQRPDPRRGRRVAVRRGRLSAEGRVRRGCHLRTGAGGNGALNPLRRREETRGVPRQERTQPLARRRRRTGLPRAHAGQPATGRGACAGGAVYGHARTRACRDRLNAGVRMRAAGLCLPAPSGRTPMIHSHSLRDEIANALTHGVGAAVALAGGAVLVTLAAIHGDGWQLAGAIVFGIALLLLYTASTLYHAIQHPVAKGRLKVFDHCAIYLLIAGTYTPFTLVGLRGPCAWGLFTGTWTLAIAGVVFKLFYTGRFRRLSTAIYVAMGWLVLVAARPMLSALDGWTLGWLLAGGACYTAGTYFYHRESIRYSHAIWHLFVLAGSVCHYVAVMAQVLAPGAGG